MSDAQVTHSEWKLFFNQHIDFIKTRDEQKLAGRHDFNILTTVLKPTDEVQLHTRFLYALLNPQGPHYQGTLFLKSFMKTIGFGGLLDYNNTTVRKEYSIADSKKDDQQNQIDLYLTDGIKHVIIENKLNAADQIGQIARYAQTIRDKYALEYTDLLFIFLSTGRQPSAKTLQWNNTTYSIAPVSDHQNTYRTCLQAPSTAISLYTAILYQKEILQWIATSRSQIEHIKSLAFALDDYQTAVTKAIKTYRSNIMTLDSFLEANFNTSKNKYEHYIQAMSIAKELPEIQVRWFKEMVTELNEVMAAHVSNERICPTSSSDCADLKKFRYEDHLATKYIKKRESTSYNKGWFWKITSGALCNKALLCVVYGKKMLHIGLLPIQLSADKNCFELSSNEKSVAAYLKAKKSPLPLTPQDAMRKKLPHLFSATTNLIDNLPALKDFSTSAQADLIEALLSEN